MTTSYDTFSSYINDGNTSIIKKNISIFLKLPNHQKLSLMEKALSQAQHDILEFFFIKTHIDNESINTIIHNALCNGKLDEKCFNFLQSHLPLPFILNNVTEFTARAPIDNLQLILHYSLLTPSVYENLLSSYIQLTKPKFVFVVLEDIQQKKIALSDKDLMSALYVCFKFEQYEIANEVILLTMKQQEKAFQSICNHVKLNKHIKLTNNSKVLENANFKNFIIDCLIHADYAYLSEIMPISEVVNKKNRKI